MEEGGRSKYLVTVSKHFLSTITFNPCFSLITKMIRNTMSLDLEQISLVIQMVNFVVPEYEKYHVWRQSGTESS